MKLKFLMVITLISAAIFSGCGDSTSDEEPSDNQSAKIEEVTPETSPVPTIPVPENDIIVDDKFSNIQLSEPNKPVYDRHTIWERQEAGLPMALPTITPYTEGKVAYLTFDDGPDDKNTPAILDILKNYGVFATFYVCGNMIEKNPEVLKRIYAEGHAIGNHSYNHNYNDLYSNTDNFLKQISDTDELIKEIIGVRPLIIRTPGGRAGMWTPEYEPLMTACGYVEHDWNVSVEDATSKKPTPTQMIRYVDEATNRGVKDNAAIILMHSNAGKESTVDALPGIIEMLSNKGYTFGVITPMTPQPW